MSVELNMPFSRAVDAAKNNFDATYVCTIASYIYILLTHPDNPLLQKLHEDTFSNKETLTRMTAAANLLISRGEKISSINDENAKTYIETTQFLSETLISFIQHLPDNRTFKGQDNIEYLLGLLEPLLRETEAAIDQTENDEIDNRYNTEQQDDDIGYQSSDYSSAADASQYFSPLSTLYFAAAFSEFIMEFFPYDYTEEVDDAFTALSKVLKKYENFEDGVMTAQDQNDVLDMLFDFGEALNTFSEELLDNAYDFPALILAAQAMDEICYIYNPDFGKATAQETKPNTSDNEKTIIYPAAFHPHLKNK